jgi:drug/metabolite transporter (DMT)-like permease
MSSSDLIKLVFLAAIWGGSFIFMRISVPEFGVIFTATLRISLAGLSLLLFTLLQRVPMLWRKNFKFYAVVGFFSAALPFSCFSYAAQFLPSAYSAVLNSTAPLFGAMFSIFWLSDQLSLRRLTALLLGITGVTVLVGAGTLLLNSHTLLATFAGLIASASYAISSILIKKLGQKQSAAGTEIVDQGIHPNAMASGSLLLGGLMLLPALPFSIPRLIPSTTATLSLLALSLMSTALAQAIFIPLISRIGPTRAMTVTFLIPIFGMLWGYLFLHEAVGISTMIGSVIVLMAMGLILSQAPAKKMGVRHDAP